MPGKLQNKRSSTLNNPPSAGTLDAGEIALNTNADSANLHFEDAGGGVRSIGADPTAAGTYVRNVSGANEVGTWTELEIPPGTIIDTDPPVDPPDGQLFFNEDNQTLWVWSEAQSTWAPAVPQVPAGGGGDYSSAELTEKVFFINEQEVNEDYTVTGTDNAGSFGPIDIANGKNVTIADGGTWTVCGGAGRSVDPAGLWSRDGSTGTLTPANPGDDIETTGDLAAADAAFTGNITAAGTASFVGGRSKFKSNGNLELINGSNLVAAISAGDGSADFADGDLVISGDGDINMDGSVSAAGNIFSEGAIATTRFGVTSQLASEETINGETKQLALSAKNGANVYRAALDYSGNLALGDDAWSTPNIYLQGSNGDITAAGTVTSGALSSSINCYYGSNDGSDAIFFGSSATSGSTIISGGVAGSPASFSITSNGDINAKGTIILNSSDPTKDTGTWIQNVGGVYTTRPTGSSDAAFACYQKGNITPTAIITADGKINATGMSLGAAYTSTLPGDGYLLVDKGVYVGSFAGESLLREVSQGSGSNPIYIGNQQIQVSSDIRLKTDIEDTKIDATERLKEVRVVDFGWDDPSDKAFNNKNARGRWTGVIAQELVDIFPFAVNAPRSLKTRGAIDHESEIRWNVNQDQLVPVLIKGFQEQQAKIEALEAKLTALSGPSTTDIQEGN